jgi:formylglycine-generating enzyme required for sulfatase activity
MKYLYRPWLFVFCIMGLLPSAKAQQPLPSAQNTTAPAAATKGAPFVNSLGMKFVPVAGTKVLFSVWETRVQDYTIYSKETAQSEETRRVWPTPDFEQGPTHPAVMLEWGDAVAFCAWLSKKEGRTYRLPTDAEWSVAVGLEGEIDGSPKDKDKEAQKVKIFPWGKVWPPPRGAGNYADVQHEKLNPGWGFIAGYDDGFAYTSPVGSFAANSFGLYDLGGNAKEFCEDWYDEKATKRVLRGGSWNYSDESFLRAAWRLHVPPNSRNGDFGFRCVLVVP